MTTYRQIHTKMWSDAWFLDLLPEEKLLFVYLFSNDHASLCGLYELPLKTMAFETGLRTDAITLTLDRFGKAGKVLYAPPYIWVPNLRKYNENASPKVAAMIRAQLDEIPDCDLKRLYLAGDMTPIDVAPMPPNGEGDPTGIRYPEKNGNRPSNSNSTIAGTEEHHTHTQQLAENVDNYPPELQGTVQAICEVWNHVAPTRKSKYFGPWVVGARDLLEACGEFKVADVLTSVRERWEAEGGQTTVTGPISLVGFARDEAARRRSAPLKTRERGNGKGKDTFQYPAGHIRMKSPEEAK